MATVQFYTKNFAGSFSQLSTSAKNSAVGIFSLKALFVSPARVLNVRNGTNSSTSDIYADVNGNLTTGAGQTLSAWLSGATGYITTWYDQSPVGNHATQVVQASQPIIDFANNQVDFKTSAWFDLPNGTVPSGNSNYTMTFKNNTIGSAAAIIHSGTQGTQNFVNAIEVNSGGYLNFWWANDIGGGAAATGTIVTAKYDNTVGRRMYKNGTQTNSDTQTTRSSTTINNFIAKDPRSYYLNGELYYICLFNTALSDADRSIVENQPAAPPAPSIPMAMTIGPGPSPVPIRIFGLPPLYPFTTFTFTPMTATGASGPGAITYGASTPGYGTTSVMTLSGGIQYWTVPYSGNYTFTIAGACGGAGGSATRGLGAVITVTLPLTQSDVVKLLVGQMGTSAVSGCPVTKGGGGGGSFVYNNTTSTILLVAGGGAGGAGGPIVTAGKADASLTTAGNAGDGTNGGAGGTSASGGIGGVSACGNTAGGNGGGGGGGYSGNGTNGSFAASNLGQSFLNGGVGGSNTAEGTTYGGFGGGGAAGHHAGGGGGGYSGGGGGGMQTCSCADTQRGGGGGSYATVSFTSSAATNTGDGYITITKV